MEPIFFVGTHIKKINTLNTRPIIFGSDYPYFCAMHSVIKELEFKVVCYSTSRLDGYFSFCCGVPPKKYEKDNNS
tara:strand:- start:14 stop:238 length:225 start_codon:yes stop_codon:yes gene_type:complete